MGCRVKLTRRYRYLVRDVDRHGNVRWYLRRRGAGKVRLPCGPESDEFDAAYRAAIGGKQPAPIEAPHVAAPGTIGDLIAKYYASAEYKQLAPSSRQARKLVLDRFRETHGDKRSALLGATHIKGFRDKLADRPEAANSLVKYLRAVLAFGVSEKVVASNPAREVPYLQSKNPGGFRQWTLAEIEAFEAHWAVGTVPRLALALLLYTGQRRSDVVRLGRQHLRDGWLTFTQVKNAGRKPVTLSIPLLPELARIIAATPSRGMVFLESAWARPFTVEGFGNAFRKWSRAAGLHECSPHGLRKAAAARLAELGCTAHEIAAITGHRTLKEVARYTAAASQKIMAASGMARMAKVSHFGPSPEKWDETAPQVIEKK